jgi:cold shock CspA family protein
MRGIVKDWFPERGYGWLLAGGGRVFVHRNALGGVQDLAIGDVVEFVVTETVRGPRAESVRVLEPAAVQAAHEGR